MSRLGHGHDVAGPELAELRDHHAGDLGGPAAVFGGRPVGLVVVMGERDDEAVLDADMPGHHGCPTPGSAPPTSASNVGKVTCRHETARREKGQTAG